LFDTLAWNATFWQVTDRGRHSEVTVRWHGYPLTFFRQRIAAPMRRGPFANEVGVSLDALGLLAAQQARKSKSTSSTRRLGSWRA
jgi:hypothetical protein